MNATDLGLFLRLPALLRRPNLPAGATTGSSGAAGTRPGAAVEASSPCPPARPVTITDATVDHVLHLVCEYGGLIRQEDQFDRAADEAAGRHDECAKAQHHANSKHARDMQSTYYAEIRDYLKGTR